MKNTSLLREPLVHFLMLGLLIFAVDYFVRPPADTQRIIKVDAKLKNELVLLFKKGQGREPTQKERQRLVNRWVQNEVYYREALMLGLDKGDEMVRSRMILKIRQVVLNNIIVNPPSDKELRDWFNDSRAKYDIKKTYDFIQFFVADEKSGNRKQADDLVLTISNGDVPETFKGVLRRYRKLSEKNISRLFGEEFASGLADQPDKKWGVLKSKKGWHLARIDVVHKAVPASFETVKAQVKTDWEKAQRTVSSFEAVKEMRDGYTIIVSDPEAGEKDKEGKKKAQAAKGKNTKPEAKTARNNLAKNDLDKSGEPQK